MNRRRFLLSVVTTVLAVQGCAGNDNNSLPEWFKQLALDPTAAAALGKAYLKDYPDESDPQLLLSSLEQAIADGNTFDALDRTVRAEYARGEVVQVKYWILSRSEARLYALISTRVSGN